MKKVRKKKLLDGGVGRLLKKRGVISSMKEKGW